MRLATRRRSARPRTGYASPPVRALPSLLRQLAGDRLAMMTAAAGYGDAVRLPMGPKTLYFFNHPDHAKHVLADNAANYHKGIGLVQARRALGDGLLTSEGELWRRQRKVVQPAFQHKRIAGQADAVAQEAAALVARLRARAGHGPVRLDQELTGLTLGVLGRTLLASDLGGFDGLGHAFEAVQDQAMFEMVTMNAVPTWVPLPGQLRFRHARARLQHVVERLTESGHPKGADAGDGTDALSRLIASVGEETDASTGRRRLRDELITLLLAGHETTASTLGWTCYLIDRHPEVRERLHEEAVEVLGDRLPSYEDLQRLPFTTATVEEVMRLYPPVWILPRQAQADDEIGGLHVPAGADVLVSPFTLHRHPRFWEAPEQFRPERFLPGARGDRPRYAHIPFGAGPRVCVGSSLGLMEAVFTVALLCRELRLEKVPGHRVVAQPMLSLGMRDGLPVTVHPVR
ncbi:putative cytochrome P450 [Streptomyces sp. Tu6071]|nr:putative cytochrome P450 [Streptomyces sp. Tu6071]